MSENNVDDKNHLEKGNAFFKKLLKPLKPLKPLFMPIDRMISILSLLVAIFAVYYTISNTNESQKSATIIRLSEDFSKIGTMNKERSIAIGHGQRRMLSPKEYRRTLQINYGMYARFIEKELGYSEFNKFNEVCEKLNDPKLNETYEKLNEPRLKVKVNEILEALNDPELNETKLKEIYKKLQDPELKEIYTNIFKEREILEELNKEIDKLYDKLIKENSK